MPSEMIVSMMRLNPHGFYPTVWIAKHGNYHGRVLGYQGQVLLLEPMFVSLILVGHLNENREAPDQQMVPNDDETIFFTLISKHSTR
jgi:hypothetical protein